MELNILLPNSASYPKKCPWPFFSDINQNNVTPAYIFLLHWCQGSLIFTWRVPQYRLPTNKKIDNLNDFWVEFKSENSPTNRRTKTHFISSKNSVPFVFESACSTKQSCRFCKILWLPFTFCCENMPFFSEYIWVWNWYAYPIQLELLHMRLGEEYL